MKTATVPWKPLVYCMGGLALCAAPAYATLPEVSSAIQVTDDGHVVGEWVTNNEDSIMVRMGNDLYFVYRHATSNNPTIQPDEIYVRKYRIGSDTTSFSEDAVEVDDTTDDAIADPDGYHTEPSLQRDATGALHVFVTHKGTKDGTYETYSIAPRHRAIADLTNQQYWSSPAALDCVLENDGGGLGEAYLAFLYDLSGVYDELSGTTHIVGGGDSFSVLFGDNDGDHNGISRAYYRILNDGTLDGPYHLVWAYAHQPQVPDDIVAWPVGSQDTRKICPGNIFTKGDIVAGPAIEEGVRSLHLVWNIRNTFNAYEDDPPCTQPCTTQCSSHWVTWNYDLYYAKSLDGGNTWTNIDGDYSHDVSSGEAILWDDEDFRVYVGDVDENTERAFDVDANGYPFLAICKHKQGTGFMVGPPTSQPTPVHPDNSHPGDNPEFGLYYMQWNGSSWDEGWIDQDEEANRDYRNSRPKVRIDMDGGVWVFAALPFENNVPSYWYRPSGGSWTGPTAFGSQSDYAVYLYSYADPVDPNFQYIAWAKTQGQNEAWKFYFRKLQLTQNLLTPVTDVPGGTYYSPVTIHVAKSPGQYEAAGVTVRYTTNGTDPTSSSSVYPSGGIYLSNGTRHIKAKSFAGGWTTSPVLDFTVTVDNQ